MSDARLTNEVSLKTKWPERRVNVPRPARHLARGNEMAKPNAKRLTLRQMRLAAWMCDPQPPPIDDERIDWRGACWNAAQLIESAGIYGDDTPTTRRQCLGDLAALTQSGVLMKLRTGDAKTGRPVWARIDTP